MPFHFPKSRTCRGRLDELWLLVSETSGEVTSGRPEKKSPSASTPMSSSDPSCFSCVIPTVVTPFAYLRRESPLFDWFPSLSSSFLRWAAALASSLRFSVHFLSASYWSNRMSDLRRSSLLTILASSDREPSAHSCSSLFSVFERI